MRARSSEGIGSPGRIPLAVGSDGVDSSEDLLYGLDTAEWVRRVERDTGLREGVTSAERDRVNLQFRADRPDALWASDSTYVWTRQGFVYVAFVIDVYARCIVGWKASSSVRTNFVLDALEQALYVRRRPGSLIHHSDRGGQYLSIRYTERLAEARIKPLIGSVGDSYDNALAEKPSTVYTRSR